MTADWLRWSLVAAALGALVLLAGVVLGSVSVSADGERCGSAWSKSTAMRADALAPAPYYSMGGTGAPDITADLVRYRDCETARSDRQAPVYVLLVVGGVLLAAGAAGVAVIRRADRL